MTRTVLFAIPALDKSGPDRVFFELLRRLDRTRFAPSIVVSQPEGYYLARLPADVTVHRLAPETSVATRYPVVPLARLVRRLRPDVVIATLRMVLTAGLAQPLFPRATRLILRPANHVSSTRAELTRGAPLKHRVSFALSRLALGRADHLICQGDDLARDLAALRTGVPMTTIGNPVDVDEVVRLGAAPAALPGSPALLATGRLSRQKGFDLLIPAFAPVAAALPGAHLTILGTGPDEVALREQIDALGLGARVTLRGFVENPYPLMRAADLFVLPSRYEGFPNAALEALACGTPVLAAACPGVPGLVFPGENGWLVPAEDVGALTRGLTVALAELATFPPLAVQASVRARFDVGSIARAYERVLGKVAA
ncbi:MAG: glycosyltransferase [Deltaproteobacteria bacterium]|nr:glycosyltransferase [Deltaproteobacteria bacterium]